MKHVFFVLMVSLASLLVTSCARKTQQSVELNLFAWSEYVPQEVIEGFQKETGIRVNYEAYDSNEAMITKLSQNPSGYDLVQPSEYAVENLIRRKMLAPIDVGQIPNMKNLEPAFRDLPYDPGQKYSVPYMSGTVGIVYNASTVKEAPKGFGDVFVAANKGRIVAVNDNREIVGWAFDVLKIPLNDVTPENLAKARPLVQNWIGLVKVFESDNPRAPMLSGDCDLGVVFSGDAAKLYEQDHKFKYVLPSEGTHRFIDNLCIPAAAAHKVAAHQFINYILRPEVSKLISDKFPYTNPNGEAKKLLGKSQLENPASYPTLEHSEVFHDIGPAMQNITAMMTELRARG